MRSNERNGRNLQSSYRGKKFATIDYCKKCCRQKRSANFTDDSVLMMKLNFRIALVTRLSPNIWPTYCFHMETNRLSCLVIQKNWIQCVINSIKEKDTRHQSYLGNILSCCLAHLKHMRLCDRIFMHTSVAIVFHISRRYLK